MAMSMRNSITFKLSVSISSILLMTIVALSIFNYYATKKRLYTRLEIQSKILAEGLNYSIEGLLVNNNMPAIQRILSNLAASKEVISISIINRNNVIIADTQLSNINKVMSNAEISKTLNSGKSNISYTYTGAGEKQLLLLQLLRGKEYLQQLRSDVVGIVYLRMSTDAVEKEAMADFWVNLGITVAITLFAFLYTILLSRILFIKPIKTIERSTKLISEGDFNVRIPKLSNDEIGHLADNLNNMASNLEELTGKVFLEKEKVILSRQAGMSEIATNILHNIGNILNSANVSMNILKEMLSKSYLNKLSKVSFLLEEHSADIANYLSADEKGKLIPSYIISLVKKHEEEQNDYLKELGALEKSITHIKEVVSMQQAFVGTFGIIEDQDLSRLVEDAIKINMLDINFDRINITRDYEKLDPIKTDRGKVLQILVNLIRNAKESLSSSSTIRRELLLRIKKCDARKVKIQVIDNGLGIAPEDISKIFMFGYTTKKEGHGFGLHSCMFTANELNGSLEVNSEGINKGATFTLMLPY